MGSVFGSDLPDITSLINNLSQIIFAAYGIGVATDGLQQVGRITVQKIIGRTVLNYLEMKIMSRKILFVCGSPRKSGNTNTLVNRAASAALPRYNNTRTDHRGRVAGCPHARRR